MPGIYYKPKKEKMLHVRLSDEVRQLVVEGSVSKQISMAEFVRRAINEYVSGESHVVRQVVASVNGLTDQVSMLRSEHVLSTAMIEAFVYSFFSVSAATGKDAEWEFSGEDEGDDESVRFHAEAVRAMADSFFAKWKKKVLSSPELKPTLTEMVVKSLNVMAGKPVAEEQAS